MVRVIPLEVIVSWPKGNHENPETRGDGLIVLTCVLVAIVTIFVMLRLYVRMFLMKWVGADDIFMVLAYVSFFAIVAGRPLTKVHRYRLVEWQRVSL
jgi:hypothetical protein